MNSLAASLSMARALVGMARSIDAARAGISTTSTLISLDELMDALDRCRCEIEDAAVILEATAEAADAATGRRLRKRIIFLKLLARTWRSTSEKQRWLRCERDYRRRTGQSTAKSVESLRRLAQMACRIVEKRVVQIVEPRVSAEEAAPAVAEDAEGTALTDFRAMRNALLAIGRGEDLSSEDSEEFKRILKGMEGLLS